MLKKIYIKNGTIFISDKNNVDINYNIINNKNKDINSIIKIHYENKGCKYKN